MVRPDPGVESVQAPGLGGACQHAGDGLAPTPVGLPLAGVLRVRIVALNPPQQGVSVLLHVDRDVAGPQRDCRQ